MDAHATTRRGVLRGLSGAAAASLIPEAAWPGTTSAPRVAYVRPAPVAGVTPFKAAIPQAALDDLALRLDRVRWPDAETVPGAAQGVPLARLQEITAYWRHGYDWRAAEAKLNAFPQFTTRIDGLSIHFLHVRSKHANALPLVLTHGWPGSVFEFIDAIGPLVDPTAHGGRAEDAFHVVIPSLPGFGFSEKPTSTGWGLPRIARAWGTLMTRLGYRRWVAQGGDWGAGVTTWLAKQHATGLAAVHLNLPILFPPPLDVASDGAPDAEEQAAIAQLVDYDQHLAGYAKVQGTRPQTIGYALADSPTAQAAWILEKLDAWSDPASHLSRDAILDTISLYWLTDSAASSARLYAESFTTDFTTQKIDLPVAVTLFPFELYQPPRKWAERAYSQLTYWNRAPRGGHFAAFEQPALFAGELRAAFRTLR